MKKQFQRLFSERKQLSNGEQTSSTSSSAGSAWQRLAASPPNCMRLWKAPRRGSIRLMDYDFETRVVRPGHLHDARLAGRAGGRSAADAHEYQRCPQHLKRHASTARYQLRSAPKGPLLTLSHCIPKFPTNYFAPDTKTAWYCSHSAASKGSQSLLSLSKISSHAVGDSALPISRFRRQTLARRTSQGASNTCIWISNPSDSTCLKHTSRALRWTSPSSRMTSTPLARSCRLWSQIGWVSHTLRATYHSGSSPASVRSALKSTENQVSSAMCTPWLFMA